MVFFLDQYIARIEEISKEIGIPLSIASVSDGMFEQGHQLAKIGIHLIIYISYYFMKN